MVMLATLARRSIIGLLMGSLALPAAPLAAAPVPAPADWAAVLAVPPGRRVTIVTRDGRRVRGRLLTAAVDQVTVRVAESPAAFPRDEVREVRVDPSGGRRAVGGLIGGIIGIVAGAFGGAFLGNGLDESEDRIAGIVLGLFIGALAGAFGGAVLGAKLAGRSGRLIYLAP